jgi:drug/metabolite transporter (DMT)-like permease
MSNTALYVITVLVWGSTWLAIEYQLGVVPPEVSIAYRYAGASLLLFAWSRFRGLRLSFSPGQHGRFFLLGMLLFGMNIINARLFFGVRAGRRVLFGSLLGVAGIFTLFAPQISAFTFSDTVFYGSMLAILGALVASFGNMASQSAQKSGLPVIQSNAWGMFYGTIITGLFSVYQGHEFTFDWSAQYIVSLLYLTVFGSIIAFGAYLTLLGRIGAHKAGYAMVMFPVVALILSALFEDLQLDATIIVGTVLVLAGNLFVLNTRPPGAPRKPRLGAGTMPAPARAVDFE